MTREESKRLQGLSVLAMVCLHLFDTLTYSDLFTPIIALKGFPLAFYFAQLSDFCVMGFAFCSGYAHMALFKEKDYYKKRLISLLSLFCNFWVILLLFSLVSIIAGKADFMPQDLATFLKTFTGISMSYNGGWWYLPVYAVIVFISPAVLKATEKMSSIVVILISFVIYIGSYFLRFKYSTPYRELNWFGPFGMTFFEYIIGVVCCKEKVFEKIEKLISKLKPIWICVISSAAFIAMLLGHTLVVRSLIIAPFTGFAIICIFKFCPKPHFVDNILDFFGKHSTNIWFTHMFFYMEPFPNLVYIAKYPIPIFLFMLAICIIASYIINLIYYPINKQIQKLKALL